MAGIIIGDIALFALPFVCGLIVGMWWGHSMALTRMLAVRRFVGWRDTRSLIPPPRERFCPVCNKPAPVLKFTGHGKPYIACDKHQAQMWHRALHSRGITIALNLICVATLFLTFVGCKPICTAPHGMGHDWGKWIPTWDKPNGAGFIQQTRACKNCGLTEVTSQ